MLDVTYFLSKRKAYAVILFDISLCTDTFIYAHSQLHAHIMIFPVEIVLCSFES